MFLQFYLKSCERQILSYLLFKLDSLYAIHLCLRNTYADQRNVFARAQKQTHRKVANSKNCSKSKFEPNIDLQ